MAKPIPCAISRSIIFSNRVVLPTPVLPIIKIWRRRSFSLMRIGVITLYTLSPMIVPSVGIFGGAGSERDLSQRIFGVSIYLLGK